jgi:hypothetical protein
VENEKSETGMDPCISANTQPTLIDIPFFIILLNSLVKNTVGEQRKSLKAVSGSVPTSFICQVPPASVSTRPVFCTEQGPTRVSAVTSVCSPCLVKNVPGALANRTAVPKMAAITLVVMLFGRRQPWWHREAQTILG